MRKAHMALLVALGFAAGSVWMYKHLTCAPCQQKFQALKRSIGLGLIE